MPYRLYALSNAGSMFALLSYPVLFEPMLTTHQQARTWSVAYGVFILLCGFTAWRARHDRPEDIAGRSDLRRQEAGAAAILMWLLLPACASVLLLAITNHLSQNVAAIPFLWILPLSLYLLSFILCFESSGWYRRNPYLQLLAVALGGMAYGITVGQRGKYADLVDAGALRPGAVHLLHGLPRGTGPPQARIRNTSPTST